MANNNNAKPHGISSRRSTIDEKELYNVAWKKPDHRLMYNDKNTLTPCLCCRRFSSTKENIIFCTRFSPLATTLHSRTFFDVLIILSPFSFSTLTYNNSLPSRYVYEYFFYRRFSLPKIVLEFLRLFCVAGETFFI